MLSFENDYSCAATPEIIARLAETAPNQYPGYGTDDAAKAPKPKSASLRMPGREIFFLVAALRPTRSSSTPSPHRMRAVVAATTGHVNVHEAGAIEFTGHKVLTLPPP